MKILLVNSIKVTLRHDDNYELDAVHKGGLVRDGVTVIERADIKDVIRALQMMVEHARPKDWNACPIQAHANDCDCGGRAGDR